MSLLLSDKVPSLDMHHIRVNAKDHSIQQKYQEIHTSEKKGDVAILKNGIVMLHYMYKLSPPHFFRFFYVFLMKDGRM